MTYMKNAKMISAILPKGVVRDVVCMLRKEKGITTANFNYARGIGKLTPMKYRGVGEQSEKEILTVVVDEAQGDEIFEYIYNVAEINRPHGGLMYMHSLSLSSEYILPATLQDER